MAFQVGQLVKCVDDSPGLLRNDRPLRRGAIYTVSAVCGPGEDDLLREGVRLAELHSAEGDSFFVYASRFRLVEDAALDVFRKEVVEA